jgi:hypothetical protein
MKTATKVTLIALFGLRRDRRKRVQDNQLYLKRMSERNLIQD